MQKVLLLIAFFSIDTLHSDLLFERHKEKIEAYWIKSGDLVIDVGANIGDCACRYSPLVGEKGKVIAYEANPYVFDVLRAGVKDRYKRGEILNNISIKWKAVSSVSQEKLWMKVYPFEWLCVGGTVESINMGKDRMPEGTLRGSTHMVEVESEKLDDLLLNEKNIGSLRYIKIDTEGHDQAVLEGAKQLLLTYRPLVLFEPGITIKDTIQLLEEFGYYCYDLITNKQVNIHDIKSTDFLAIPVENLEEITNALPNLY